MGNCLKITKRLFTKSTRLAAILNKSRIFNTWESIIEFLSIIFYNIIPSRTNQTFIVGLYNAQAIVCILGHLFIHVSPKKHFFRNSIIVNVLAQVFMIALIWLTIKLFQTLMNDCNTIWTYYSVIGKEALAQQTCLNAIMYYTFWMLVNIIIIVLRIFSLVYMVKSFRYLMKRELEKLRKRQRRIQKEKRIRREKKKALQKLALEKKNDMLKNQEILINEMEERAQNIQKQQLEMGQ